MRREFYLAAAFLLAGCAGGSPARPTLAPPAAGDVTADNQAALYLGAVDGLVKQARYGAALAFLDRYAVVQKAPVPRYWLLRGEALLGSARPGEAQAAFDRLKGTAFSSQGWNGKGRAAAARKDWRDAAADFQSAVQADPANADFLNNLAFASLALGRSADAVQWLRQAHELDPHSALIRDNLVIALSLRGDRDGADKILQSVADKARREKLRAAIAALVQTALFSPEVKS